MTCLHKQFQSTESFLITTGTCTKLPNVYKIQHNYLSYQTSMNSHLPCVCKQIICHAILFKACLSISTNSLKLTLSYHRLHCD